MRKNGVNSVRNWWSLLAQRKECTEHQEINNFFNIGNGEQMEKNLRFS